MSRLFFFFYLYLLLQLTFLLRVHSDGEILGGGNRRVGGANLVGVEGLLHCVLFVRCVEHLQVGFFNYLPQKRRQIKLQDSSRKGEPEERQVDGRFSFWGKSFQCLRTVKAGIIRLHRKLEFSLLYLGTAININACENRDAQKFQLQRRNQRLTNKMRVIHC